jgi:hypothetical protein
MTVRNPGNNQTNNNMSLEILYAPNGEMTGAVQKITLTMKEFQERYPKEYAEHIRKTEEYQTTNKKIKEILGNHGYFSEGGDNIRCMKAFGIWVQEQMITAIKNDHARRLRLPVEELDYVRVGANGFSLVESSIHSALKSVRSSMEDHMRKIGLDTE